MLQEISVVLSFALNVTNSDTIIDILSSFYRAMYAITTRSLSRHSLMSERSWFRFLTGQYDWVKGSVALFSHFIHRKKERYLLAFDETMQAKSRKKTYGIEYFYNSILGIAQRGVGFFGVSLIGTTTQKSYFMGIRQVIRTDEDKARTAAQKAKKTTTSNKCNKAQKASKTSEIKKPGRPKGSKNEPKESENVVETPAFRSFKALFGDIMTNLKATLPELNLRHIVGDNAYATLQYMELALKYGLCLISKAKRNSAITLPFEYALDTPYKRGRKRVFGARIDNESPPRAFLVLTSQSSKLKTEYFQLQGYMQGVFKQILLNILIVRTTNLETKKVSILIFFSNDLTLNHLDLWDWYHLRYQIEFDFRDAKQHFGFADFKNYRQNNVTNFVNLVFIMCLVSKIIIPHYRQTLQRPSLSITDFKLIENARFSIKSFFITTKNTPDTIFNQEAIDKFIPNFIINAA